MSFPLGWISACSPAGCPIPPPICPAPGCCSSAGWPPRRGSPHCSRRCRCCAVGRRWWWWATGRCGRPWSGRPATSEPIGSASRDSSHTPRCRPGWPPPTCWCCRQSTKSSARCCWRRWRQACRWWRPPSAASRTRSARRAGWFHPVTRPLWPPPSTRSSMTRPWPPEWVTRPGGGPPPSRGMRSPGASSMCTERWSSAGERVPPTGPAGADRGRLRRRTSRRLAGGDPGGRGGRGGRPAARPGRGVGRAGWRPRLPGPPADAGCRAAGWGVRLRAAVRARPTRAGRPGARAALVRREADRHRRGHRRDGRCRGGPARRGHRHRLSLALSGHRGAGGRAPGHRPLPPAAGLVARQGAGAGLVAAAGRLRRPARRADHPPVRSGQGPGRRGHQRPRRGRPVPAPLGRTVWGRAGRVHHDPSLCFRRGRVGLLQLPAAARPPDRPGAHLRGPGPGALRDHAGDRRRPITPGGGGRPGRAGRRRPRLRVRRPRAAGRRPGAVPRSTPQPPDRPGRRPCRPRRLGPDWLSGMRVLLLANHYRPGPGGAEAVLLASEALLRERGHQPIPFAVREPDTAPTPWAVWFPPVAGAGARTEAGRRLAATASRPAQDALHRLLDAARPDVAHVHHVFEGLTLSVVDVLLARRVPVVMTLHDYKPVCPNYRLYAGGRPCQRCLGGGYWNVLRHRCLEGPAWRGVAAAVDAYWRRIRRLWERVDLFVAPSRYLRDRMVAGGLPAGRVTVVPNPVELPPDPPPAARRGPARFLYTGRLVAEKGLDDLLIAAASLRGGGRR